MSAKRKTKKRKWITVSIITVVVIGIAASLILRPAVTAYESVEAKTGDIVTYYSFSGNVETKHRQTAISSSVMQVADLYVKEGDLVNEGDVLLKTTMGAKIKAEIDGEVSNISVEENEQVMAGVTLLEVVDYQALEISVKVDEYDLPALAVGKQATVKISALDKQITGTISSVSKEGQVSNDVTYFTATIDLEKEDSVKIGMSAEVTLLGDSATGVVTLPMTAIQFDDSNQPYVLKKDAKGQPVKTAITVGINDGTTVEVTSGITSGDTILYEKTDDTQNLKFTKNSTSNRGEASVNG